MQPLLSTFAFLALAASSHAAIVLTGTGQRVGGNYSTSDIATTAYTPTDGTNSVLVVQFSADGATTGGFAATFGGVPMTRVAETTQAVVFYLVNPGTVAGNIVLTGGVNTASDTEFVSWGLVTGVDTTTIQIATGTGYSAGVQSAPTFPGLVAGDAVYAAYRINNSSSSYTDTSIFASRSGGAADHDAATAFSVLDLALTYESSAVANAAGTVPQVTALAFKAIPEPSSAALVGICGGIALLRRRKRTA